MKRRNFIKLVGGGIVLAASGATLFSMTRTPSDALAPWGTAGIYDDPRSNALSYAILAPNPHNRQPWIIRLDGEDGLTLFFDTEKQLEHTDPSDRQLTIGLGCFLELLRMAANAEGYDVDIILFPEGEDAIGLDRRPIANAVFKESKPVSDPLFVHTLNRRSNKMPFDTSRSVQPDALARIMKVARQTEVGGSINPKDIAYWRKLSTRAQLVETETPRTHKESIDLMRIGKAEINANPDGISLSGVLFESLAAAGILTRGALFDRSSTGYKEGLKAVLENTQTAMGHLWMVTQGNSRHSQIAAGADWLRINLACTAEGLSFQPLSQALQEYPEMVGLYDETHQRLAREGGKVQMLARIGYGQD
ncbi:MAG: twin-arginine translocation pathway signal protein, partial [Sulfitobacter sp.]